jgi:hypothetical protein
MKIAIAKEHRDFFQQKGWIEFENFLSPETVAQFNQHIDQVLSERLENQKLTHARSDELFMKGRDLWRSSSDLRKLTCQPRFAEIASELMEKKPVRLGYDQLFPARHTSSYSQTGQVYTKFLQLTAALDDISCIRGLLCGLMICLSAPLKNAESTPLEEIDIFPSAVGNAVFFQPHIPVDLSQLKEHPDQRYYLIVYTENQAQYYLQPQDPHTHVLKHLGYGFNDKLFDKLNPIVYR